MSKCVGNCAKCELDVDKMACCQYQTFKNILEIKAAVNELKMAVLEKESDFIQYKTVDDLEDEPSKE